MNSPYARRCALELHYVQNPENPAKLEPLGGNRKTDRSLDFMVRYCQPTPYCARRCYACIGKQAHKWPVRRVVWFSLLAEREPVRAADMVIASMIAKGITELRLFGTGDYHARLFPFFRKLAELFRKHGFAGYGFTKKPEGYMSLRGLGFAVTFSLDDTSPKASREFAVKIGYENCCYVATETSPCEPRTACKVTFPDHRSAHKVPIAANDCPAIREHRACGSCRVCKE